MYIFGAVVFVWGTVCLTAVCVCRVFKCVCCVHVCVLSTSLQQIFKCWRKNINALFLRTYQFPAFRTELFHDMVFFFFLSVLQSIF